MIDPDNITSMTEFKRDSGRWLRRMRKTGKPGVLTVNGRAEVVIMDAASYRRLMQEVEASSVMVAVERSMREYRDGKTVPASEAIRRMRPSRKAT